MIYKLGYVLRVLNIARREMNRIVMYTGFGLLLVLVAVSYVHMTIGLTPGEPGTQMDLLAIVGKWDGKIGYVFIAALVLFLVSNATPYILRFRNWWVHTDNHKVEIRNLKLWLGKQR